MVFQDWSLCVTTSHLSYTFDQGCHCEAIVKVHGVLPSSRWYSASSRRMQFHRVHVGDSGAVVTPFVQVATYATRNFATLGQLELLPPFTRRLPFKAYNTSPFDRSAPDRCQTLHGEFESKVEEIELKAGKDRGRGSSISSQKAK